MSSPVTSTHTLHWRRLVWGLVVIAVAQQLWALRLPAVWIDEVFSIRHSASGLATLWGEGWALETNPPGYYTLVWAWQRLVPADVPAEPLLRLLSVLCMAATAWFVSRSARLLAGDGAGALAALLVTMHPLVFEYALEIRPYALFNLLVAVAVWAWIALWLGTKAQASPGRRQTIGLLLVLMSASVAMIYVHAVAPLVLAALSLSSLALMPARRHRGPLLVWLLMNVLVVLAALPQVLVALSVVTTNAKGLAWYPGLNDRFALFITIRALLTGQYTFGDPLTRPFAFLVVLAYTLAAWRARGRPLLLAVGVLMPALGLAFLFVASLVQPVLLARTALWTTVPCAILLGATAARVRGPRQAAATALMVVVAALMGLRLASSSIEGRNHWRPYAQITQQLQARMQAGDRLVVVDRESLCVLHYYGLRWSAEDAYALELGAQQQFVSGQRIDLGCNRAQGAPSSTLPRLASTDRGVWIVAWGDGQRQDADSALATVAASLVEVERLEVNDMSLAVRLVPRR